MAGMDTRGRRIHLSDASASQSDLKFDFTFAAGALVTVAGAILLSLALGTPVPPEALMLVGP